jgi:hypothetical protein
MCYISPTNAKTLELAMRKAEMLPEAEQEQLGREILERMDSLAQLRSEVEIGLRDLDAGLGKAPDIDEIIRVDANRRF